MLKLIVGLGNPGRKYEKTRHNAGFWFLEGLALEAGAKWRHESKFQSELSSIQINGQQVVLLKPDTFMNRSGQAVGKLARYYEIQPEEILVVHDELDFEAGVVRLKVGGGHAGHNGLKDIMAHLGSKNFCRLRLGIGGVAERLAVSDYVLSEPSKDEKEKIVLAMSTVYGVMGLLVSGRLEQVMSQLH